MKKYYPKIGHYHNLMKYDKYYALDRCYHGLFLSLSYNRKCFIYKGYYNMNLQYGHWLYNGETFNYFL